MVFDDKYFTVTDTSSYFTLAEEEKRNQPPAIYQNVTLGESFHPQKTPLQGVDAAIRHGLPSVMITLMEPNMARGDQALPSQIERFSKLQQNAVGELMYINKTNFVLHAPIVDIMGLGGKEGQQQAISGQQRAEHFNILKSSIEQADNIAKAAGLENPVISLHTTNGPAAVKTVFDSGFRDNDGKPILGERNSVVNKDTGQIMPVDTRFERLPKGMGEGASLLYEEVQNTMDKNGNVMFKITPEKSIAMQNRTALSEHYKNLADAQIRLKQLRETGNYPEGTKIADDIKLTILSETRAIQRIEATFGAGEENRRQFVSLTDYSNDIVPDQVAKLAMTAFKTDTKPVLAFENEPGWQLGSDPELLTGWVDKSRKKFAEMLEKDEKLSREDAKKKSEELIGITFDTGHLNTLKQQIKPGTDRKYTNEDLQELATTLAKKGVKAVHLADNMGEFGVDSHMMIGRGDVQMDEFMKILKENGFKGTMQFEAFAQEGEFDKAFQSLSNVMGLGSPIYSTYASPTSRDIGLDFSTPYSMRNVNYGHNLSQMHWSSWGGPFAGLQSTFGAGGGKPKDEFTETPTE
ncbi:endonuclease 4 [Candidatus Tiddalikarchaeum anstoanum]|nr:endonuclease 4 [Candidatus Tiddalikarchaeum anstoanum]